MSWTEQGRGYLFTAFVALTALVASCSNVRPASHDAWVVSARDSCDALSVGWNVDRQLLQDIVGPDYRPASTDEADKGVLVLSLVACQKSNIDGEHVKPFTAAFVSVILDDSAMQRVVSGLSDNRLASLPLVVTEGGSAISELFSRQHFVVLEGSTRFDIFNKNRGLSAKGTVQFESGAISIRSDFGRDLVAESSVIAAVGTRNDLFNAISGPLTSEWHLSGSASVTLDGVTILSDLGLSGEPALVRLDRQLSWKLNFWQDTLL